MAGFTAGQFLGVKRSCANPGLQTITVLSVPTSEFAPNIFDIFTVSFIWTLQLMTCEHPVVRLGF